MPSRVTPCRTIALTGFMGAGKSTVGIALAQHLEWKFIDLDEVIERTEGVTIPELFLQHGEAAFRQIESAALNRVLDTERAGLVIALGGGTFVQPANAQLLREHSACVVFLETSLETMIARCCVDPETGTVNPRPLAADPLEFQQLYERRLPSYRAADLTVDTEGKPPEAVAREIEQQLAASN